MTAPVKLLRPSGAARRMQCPGSRALCELYPSRGDNPKAVEGTIAHAVNKAVFFNQPFLPGVEPSEEMLDGAELWKSILEPYRDSVVLEEYVSCHTIHEECGGTPDAYSVKDGVLRVWDYKFGHAFVDVFENWQLVEYAVGIYNSTTEYVSEVELTVVQPRCYRAGGLVRNWRVPIAKLDEYGLRLSDAEAASMEPNAELRVGPECTNCSARHVCPALRKAGNAGSDYATESTPEPLDDGWLGRELATLTDMRELMSARISGLTAEALARGGAPGWIIERGVGRKRWARPISEVVAMGEMMGIPVAKPGAITPTQAIKAGLPAELVNTFSETPAGEIKLVRDNGRTKFGD